MLVYGEALGWKGLASSDAKKSFLLIAHALINKWSILTCFYYCWGLPIPFEGYFVLLAAILHLQSVISLAPTHAHTHCIIYMHIYIYNMRLSFEFLRLTNFSHFAHHINSQSLFRSFQCRRPPGRYCRFMVQIKNVNGLLPQLVSVSVVL